MKILKGGIYQIEINEEEMAYLEDRLNCSSAQTYGGYCCIHGIKDNLYLNYKMWKVISTRQKEV